MTTTKTRLAATLSSGRLALTAECLPPQGADASAIKGLSGVLPPNLDALVVADNPDEIRVSALACAAILAGEGRPAILSMVTRDRNRIALQSEALGAAALGVDGVVCLSGDHQSLGACPEAAGACDIDSIQFAQALKRMAREGLDFGGRTLDAPPELLVGAVAHPYLTPVELSLLRLKKKIAAGVDFLLTQAVFDFEGFTRWMEAVRGAGLDSQAAIIASVLPLASAGQAKALDQRRTYGPVGPAVIARLEQSADPAREGVAIASEMAARLKGLPGVRGIHILCGGCESLTAGIIREAGLG